MRIVIIGGSGFIGSSLIEYLGTEKAEIICCDYREPIYRRTNVSYIRMLDENIEFYKRLFHEDDVVIILKWKGVPATYKEAGAELIENNIVGTMVLVEACTEKNVKKIIFASSGGAVYGNTEVLPVDESVEPKPVSLYATQKLMVETYLQYMLRTKRVNILILRISNPYGPYQKPFNGQGIIATFLACALLGKTAEIWGDGNCIRDYLYIDDLAECIKLCITRPVESGIYNVGSEHGISIYEIVALIEKTTGRKMKYIKKDVAGDLVKNNILDCKKIKRCLKWQCTVEMEDGIARMQYAWKDTLYTEN